MTQEQYQNYIKILRSELIPAMGCTEPIAVAFAAAKAREVLGCMPEAMVARCSGNIIKNVKSVIVPNSGNERGVEAAAVLGAVAGQADLGLQVISQVTPEQIARTKELLAQKICRCELEEGEGNLYILITVTAGDQSAAVEVRTKHDHISRIVRNGEVLFEQPDLQVEISGDKSQLNLKDILEFANTVDLEDVRELLETQISYNTAIAEEGLNNFWGASVGCSHEQLLRALTLSNLISIHQKRFIGNLSAYCGAVSAGTAAACGIAYLQGADYDVIGATIVNAVGTTGGIICDGAKSSCASKISASVEAGVLGYEMARRGRKFQFGEGIVSGSCSCNLRQICYTTNPGG